MKMHGVQKFHCSILHGLLVVFLSLSPTRLWAPWGQRFISVSFTLASSVPRTVPGTWGHPLRNLLNKWVTRGRREWVDGAVFGKASQRKESWRQALPKAKTLRAQPELNSILLGGNSWSNSLGVGNCLVSSRNRCDQQKWTEDTRWEWCQRRLGPDHWEHWKPGGGVLCSPASVRSL